jgi:zinc protease
VFVDAKPAEAEKVANLVLDEISKLKQTGADAKEIERFTILDARATQGNFRQNVFWAGYLSTSSQNEEDPDNLLHRIQKLSDVTPQSTKDAANKYLSGTNMIKLILLPEKK